jgi:outer membrane protein OmpA-like peptidoglycan-associated protein
VFKENPVNVLIEDLGTTVNSEYADYAPNISADESVLVFTSRRPGKEVSNSLADDLEYYEEIHMSKRVDGKWQPSVNVGGPLNTAFHNANISLSPNGKEMFVYSDENGGDLYETELGNDGKWEKPKRLNGYINSPYLENSAAVTSDDKKLFFVSDRPGGYGGTDIYVAFKNKRGEWSEVQNLGSVINTDRDEEDVFVSANGQHIYFSSNGHAGMGDLDIYRSTFDSATMQWSEPLNLGYPVNSVENDIYFVLSGDERYAYISSLRENSVGDQDIYRVDLKNWKPMTRKELMEKELTEANLLTPVNVTANFNIPQNSIELRSVNELRPSANTPVTLMVAAVDEVSGNPIDASVKLIDDSKREIVLEKSGDAYRTTIQNQGYKKYQILAEAVGYQSARSTIHLMGNGENNTIKESLSLRKIESSVPFVINLYYDVNRVMPNNPEALNMLKSLMLENQTAKVLVEGHTDNTGEADYNLQLSQKRVDAVKKILVEAGIQSERISATGYGESRPLTDNATYNGRKLNRRTMFTIIK